MGLKTVCIEKRDKLGGTCLNVGCIPSKALLNISHKYHDAHDFKDIGIHIDGKIGYNWEEIQKAKSKVVNELTGGISYLFKKNKTDEIHGHGKIVSKNEIEIDGKEIIQADNMIIATGSEPTILPGFEFDEKIFLSSTGALALEKVPETMIVIGAGVIGLELGSVYQRMGTKVTVIEYFDRVLPILDNDLSKDFQRQLKKDKIKFLFSKKCLSGEIKNGKAVVNFEDLKTQKKESLEADVCLIATGRKPYTENLGLENVGIKTDKFGKIPINDSFQTSQENIFAIGDAIEGPMLAHKAEEEGVAVAEFLTGRSVHINYASIPGVIYTHPEIAYVGHTEETLKAENIQYKKGIFPLSANSRAKTNLEKVNGFVKVLADKETDRILGAHIMAPQAGDLIQEFVLAIEYGASAEDIARTCHAHPSLSEALKEAAMAAYFKAIHI